MPQGWIILLTSFIYLAILFAIAFYGDKRADEGRSIIANPYIYALSMAVYATSWTFYGSVGKAATSGVGFLPIYIGPTLMAALWWLVLRKMIRISKTNKITTIADFIASRYGKDSVLGSLVTIIAVIGIIPYIALQLKAVSNSFTILLHYPTILMPEKLQAVSIAGDTALYVSLFLAAFAIFFGTRHLDAAERHEGMVIAIAFESLVKLLAFIAVGIFVTFGIYDGFGDIFTRVADDATLNNLLTLNNNADGYGSWTSLMFLSMFAILCLPRQFQMGVVENVDEKYLDKAIWLFPLYMFAINIFVLPIAFAGLMQFAGDSVDADTFVLTLSIAKMQRELALFVFIGGLSAATSMIIVETIALSTMVCNDLVMPLLLRWKILKLKTKNNLSGLLLNIRRGTIVILMMLGYTYYRVAGDIHTLVSIGLVSFAAVIQFAPAMLGGMYWKGGTRAGALSGLSAGFLLWAYTLLLPSFVKSDWLPLAFVEYAATGIELLNPQELFGLRGLDPITHSLFWSLGINLACYIGVSLLGGQSIREHTQALLFVDVFKLKDKSATLWRGSASISELRGLIRRFLGPERADAALTKYAVQRGYSSSDDIPPDMELVQFAEIQLAGAIGTASAHAMVTSVVQEEPLAIDEVLNILDEASQVIAYSRQLEKKSNELEAASKELREANERLKELDRLKNDFLATIAHELRTPLTSICAITEILAEDPKLHFSERVNFLQIIMKESKRLTRLINQILDFTKVESGLAVWQMSALNLKEVIEDAVAATSQIMRNSQIALTLNLPASVPTVVADYDRLIQVLLNLLSNAIRCCDKTNGQITITLSEQQQILRVDVKDNGHGVKPEDQEIIFEKFCQIGDTATRKPDGTGLGLPISRHIVNHFGGRLWVESTPGNGAMFSFTIPCKK